MKVQELSKPAVLLIEAAGLIITAALLFVIALTLKLSMWLTTLGAVAPDLGVLAFGFLFYVCAGFLSAGTRDRPQWPGFVLANVALHAGFLGAAWLLWRPALSGAWVGFGVALSTCVHAAVCLAARYRARLITTLLRWPAARPAATVESLFHAHTAPYRAIPIGAALGTLIGSLLQAPAPERVRHIAAAVFAALALDALRRLLAGAAGLARPLAREDAGVTRVELRRQGADASEPPSVLVPRASSPEARAEAVAVAGALRRVLLCNQLPRVLVLSLGALTFSRLELPALPLAPVMAVLVVLALTSTVGSSHVGQRAVRQRLLDGAGRNDASQPSAAAPTATWAAPDAWGAVMGALALGLVAARCALPVVIQLLR